MSDTNFLIRDLELEQSQDFAALRAAGLSQIEALAHELWTDYNVHDPGITLLEVLCYGITDLGYRTAYDLKDLLTKADKGVPIPNLDFHTAREILTTGPVTFNDLRKLLVDIRGVRHAWVEKHTASQFDIHRNYRRTVGLSSPFATGLPASVEGLYDVYVEFEEFVDDLHVGLEDNRSGKGKYEWVDVGRMRFVVERELVIKRVHIYADSPGEIAVALRDQDGNFVLEQKQVLVHISDADTKTPVDLNFLVVPQTDPTNQYYYLEVIGPKDIKLYAQINEEYCFELDDLIELVPDTDADTIHGNYYYFYDWHIDFPDPKSTQYPTTYRKEAKVGMYDYYHGAEVRPLLPDGKAIQFHVEAYMNLEAIHLFADNQGDLVVYVRDFKGEVLLEKKVEIREPNRKTRIELELSLEPFQYYEIEARSEKIKLRASYDASFPYTEPGVISLLGGTTDGVRLEQKYYFFYDWEINYVKTVDGDAPDYPFTRSAVLGKIRDQVLSNRNLGEDLVCVKELGAEEVGICGDIHLASDVNVEAVLAEIYYQMEQHIKPPVRFYSIEELQAKGRLMNQIFEGPKLEHGFIDDEEFRALSRTRSVRASDVIHLLMDIPGVLSVNNLRIRSFIDEMLAAEEDWIWCASEDACRLANFSPTHSRIVFYKKGMPFYANEEETRFLLEEKEAQDLRIRLRAHENDLPVPQGEDMEVIDYYPVQNDLPLTYMVGQYGLPESASDLRKAQARQLKGYLLFFEQLLANYLAQLSEVGSLFSWRGEEVKSYYTQPLGEIDDLEELYIDYPNLQADLEAIIEDDATAQDRKLRFLEHLTGRFAESFTDYSLLMYNVYKDKSTADTRLIQDKKRFLQDYPTLSARRAGAYDYRYPETRDNISGFKHRIYRLLGFENATRNPLAEAQIKIESQGDQWTFVVRDESGKIIFSGKPCHTKAAASTNLDSILKIVSTEGAYSYAFNDCKDYWELVLMCERESDNQVLGVFADPDEMEKALEYLKTAGNAEGFQLIENVLLRMRTPADSGMLVQNVSGDDPEIPQVRDPYSFRLSIILPAWSCRFQDVNFRQYVEETIRKEAPAHVFVRICWVRHEEMRELEACLKAWECELACLPEVLEWACDCESPDSGYGIPNDNYEAYQQAHAALIQKLHSLEQVYPAARLHDCETTTGDTPQVTLGSTNLSTLG